MTRAAFIARLIGAQVSPEEAADLADTEDWREVLDWAEGPHDSGWGEAGGETCDPGGLEDPR